MKALAGVLNVMEKISNVCAKILDYISGLLIALCALDLFYQVVYRFIIVRFITIPSMFTEELARYALIWITYLSISVCFRSGGMSSVNFVYDRLSPVPKKVLYYITRAVILFFLAYGIYFGYRAVLNNLNYKSPMMHVPGVALYSAPFVGCVLMAFECITEILSVTLGRTEPFAPRCESKFMDTMT